MAMTPEEEAAHKARLTQRLHAAAFSAVDSGVTPDDARSVIEKAIAEVLASPLYKARQQRAVAAR